MDFGFDEAQQAVSQSAAGVFGGLATDERAAEIERTDDRFDDRLWAELARANLLGLAVPESDGGSGLGLTEVCLVLEQQGRTVAPVPLWATLVLGAMPIAKWGTADQRSRWLPGVVSGEVRLSAALAEVGAREGSSPPISAVRDGESWLLSGTAFAVPQAHLAERVIVPAHAREGLLLALVDPKGVGAALQRAVTTDRQVHPHLQLDNVRVEPADVLASPGETDAVLAGMLELARTGLGAIALGVAEEAISRTAVYLNERHQFGKPLSTFQGAKMRAADAWIDTEAIRVTLWEAAWRIDTGRSASEAVAVAKWWASEAGQRVVHATQHLHGGMGADIEYPIHRFFLWGKQIELMLGTPPAELEALGDLLATELKNPELKNPERKVPIPNVPIPNVPIPNVAGHLS
jgi:3-oxocholest-4-en-26-oyl-CoA dehydrogenase beta subunit